MIATGLMGCEGLGRSVRIHGLPAGPGVRGAKLHRVVGVVMGDCPICGVPAMHGMSGVCGSSYCREQWERARKSRARRDAYRDECRDYHDNVKTREDLEEK